MFVIPLNKMVKPFFTSDDIFFRGQKEVAVLLLQNGIDTNVKNARGTKNILFLYGTPLLVVLSYKSMSREMHTPSFRSAYSIVQF